MNGAEKLLEPTIFFNLYTKVCCTLLYVPSSFAIILMEKRELVALLCLVCLPGVS